MCILILYSFNSFFLDLILKYMRLQLLGSLLKTPIINFGGHNASKIVFQEGHKIKENDFAKLCVTSYNTKFLLHFQKMCKMLSASAGYQLRSQGN